MSINQGLKNLFLKAGLDVSRFHRKKLLEFGCIDTVLDIGANTGGFAKQLRYIGYKKRIISFEPLSSAFRELEKNSKNDKNWKVFNFALGDLEENRNIFISSNSTSSSLLNMLPSHLQSAPDSRYLGSERIIVRTLDSVFPEFCNMSNNVYMKIDTQGFESKVIKGGEASLNFIKIVQMEMSLVPLYETEILFLDMAAYMKDIGFSLIGIEPGFYDHATGRVLQVDGIFLRS
jgi:FkbM family methyltransferase